LEKVRQVIQAVMVPKKLHLIAKVEALVGQGKSLTEAYEMPRPQMNNILGESVGESYQRCRNEPFIRMLLDKMPPDWAIDAVNELDLDLPT